MPILINCPKCKSELKVSKKKAGRKGRCPKCGTTMQVPPLTSARQLASARVQKERREAEKLATLRDRRSRTADLLKIVLVVVLALTAVEIVESLYTVFHAKLPADAAQAKETAKTLSGLWERLTKSNAPSGPAHGLSSLLFGVALLVAAAQLAFMTKVFDGWRLQGPGDRALTVQASLGTLYAMLVQLGLLYWAAALIRDSDLMLPTIILGAYFVVGALWRAGFYLGLPKPVRKRIPMPLGWACTHAIVGGASARSHGNRS